jgi:malic enzyme
LEDIAAPHCFYIETELKKRLNIPVFHDDQHGTAIVVLAGLINALKLKGNAALADQTIVISGAGAAAIAIGKLLHQAGATNLIFIDSKGSISSARNDLNAFKQELLPLNRDDVKGNLQDALN